MTAHAIADDLTRQTPLHWPVTAHLFVPDAWLDDAERRKQAHIPDAVKAQTKHDVALDVIDRARTWKVPFRVVLADAGYGRVARFIQGLEERHLLYVCGVDKAFGVRRPADVQAVDPVPPPRMGKTGRPRKAHPAAVHLAHKMLAELPTTAWQTVAWRAGSKGTMHKQFVALRMHMATGEAGRSLDDPRVDTGPEGWLIGERPLNGSSEHIKYYWSNVPTDRPLKSVAAHVRARWPIEPLYEDAKQECGRGDYQGRRWDGLHRHVAVVMRA